MKLVHFLESMNTTSRSYEKQQHFLESMNTTSRSYEKQQLRNIAACK
jgi:hypothetical protein